MTSAENLKRAILGTHVERVPIWLREGFNVGGGPASADHFRCGWQAEPLYQELWDYVSPHICGFSGWGNNIFNRWGMIPPSAVRTELRDEGDEKYTTYTVDIGSREVCEEVLEKRGFNTGWGIRHLVESPEDLERLMQVPFEIDADALDACVRSYHDAKERNPQQSWPLLFLPSCMAAVSGTMTLEYFLELSLTENELIHDSVKECQRRMIVILEALLERIPDLDTCITLGGSEQCTPPMMRPEAFDEFVVPYDTPVIQLLKNHGQAVTVHCHGKTKHALKCMVKMGADATDPIEPPPQGDVTIEEARAIAGDKLTLMGNLEWCMLEHAEPSDIRQEIRRALETGTQRLVLGASGGPISSVTRRLVDNYKAWIDAALEFERA